MRQPMHPSRQSCAISTASTRCNESPNDEKSRRGVDDRPNHLGSGARFNPGAPRLFSGRSVMVAPGSNRRWSTSTPSLGRRTTQRPRPPGSCIAPPNAAGSSPALGPSDASP
jgi:hypothetical protein